MIILVYRKLASMDKPHQKEENTQEQTANNGKQESEYESEQSVGLLHGNRRD